MQNVTIGRYDGQHVIENGVEIPNPWAGWIEGVREDGTSWITYLDAEGTPALHWPHRTETGAVIGSPIDLRVA